MNLIFSLLFNISLNSCSHHKCIIVGDFNFPDIHWSSLTCSSHLSHHLCDFIFDYNLSQHVLVPTHLQGNTLDLVITSPGVSISDLVVSHPAQSIASDHFIISFVPLCDSPNHCKHKSKYVFDFSKADYDSIRSFLLDTNFSVCLRSGNIEFIWAMIKSFLYHAMCLYIPKIRLRSQQDPLWFNPSIRHQINCLNTLRRKFRSHPSPLKASKIELLELQLQQCISSAKSNFESQLLLSLHPNGMSKVFRYIRNITGENNIPNVVYHQGISAESEHEKVDMFNRYFHSIFTMSSFNCPNFNQLSSIHPNLSDISITEEEVFQTLSSLDPSKAAGCDGIGPKLLRHCALALYQPLHHLFCLSLSQSYIPAEWRLHLIKPIFKSGERCLVQNYRPISLLCVSSKVLEKIIFNHILQFANDKISTHQFGFMHHRSTLQQWLIVLNAIFNSSSNSSQTDLIYLDFKKAFDSVAHNELLFKLWHFGITGNTWKWLLAYLFNRSQCVSINSTTSTSVPVISGVPQGSILGPLLFLIYINDLPDVVMSSKVLLFADDVKCFKSISNYSDSGCLQDDISRLATWSSTWSLPFNVKKCSIFSVFSRGHYSQVFYPYFLNDVILTRDNTHNDLGIVLTSDLKWRDHYKSIMAKSYKILGLLRRVFSSVHCHQAKKVLYISLVRSKLLYCSPIWRPHLLSDIKALESVQRRATTFILNSYDSDYRLRLLSLQLLPLMMILEINDVLFFVKSLKEPTDHFDISRFVTFCSGCTRLASSLKLKHSLVTTNNSTRNFYFNRLPRLWNSLPLIDISQSLSTIKIKLYKHFWNHFTANFDPDNLCSYHYLCSCANCSSLPVSYNFNTSLL